MNQETLLERVVAELARRKGELRQIADLSGVPYDTVLRIKNRENDPGFSKVQALAECLFPDEARSQTPAPFPTAEVPSAANPSGAAESVASLEPAAAKAA